MTQTPLRLVLLSELLWQAKRAIDCVLAFTGRRWEP